MRKLISVSVLAIAFASCGPQDMTAQDFSSLRGGGKADGWVDTTLSCQGSCGSIAWNPTGYCGCDDECASYGDCCDDAATVCHTPGSEIVITKAMNGQSQTIKVGDTIDVQLRGNPTTGYAWELLASSRSFPLQKKVYLPDQPVQTGSGGTYHFYFAADSFSAGHKFQLDFAYYRSWDGPEAAIDSFTITIQVLPTEQACQAIDSAYQAAIGASAACSADSECGSFVGGTLACGIPLKAINTAHLSQVEAFRSQWQAQSCGALDWTCPLLAPLPPWFETRGVCELGQCQVKYVDTRGAQEGDSCGDDIGVQCADGLYCAFGLNWCGTPPVTGVCRTMGSCGTESDCLDPANSWVHPMCVGDAACTAGQCTWHCGHM